MDLTKRPDESNYDYHKRLVYGKLVDKTLADADYSEIAELIYGKPYSSDVARRMLYGSRQTLEMIDRSNIDSIKDTDIVTEIEAKKVEIQKERVRLSDQRRELNKLVSYDARMDHLKEIIQSSADRMIPMDSMIDLSDFPNIGATEMCGNEAVLVFSDWHYGLIANNVFNKYDTAICKERVSLVVRKAIERIVLHGCSVLRVVFLGDAVHGAIHVGARVMSEELVSDQLMNVSEIMAQAVCALSKYVDHTYVYMTYGNHARTVQNKNDSVHRDNLERIIPWWLEQRLKDFDNITINTPSENEFLWFESCGYEFCASHGDLDGVKGSPRLVATLFQKKFGRDIDYILLGDKHHRESFEELGITSMICGSLCGADDYANEHRLYSDPSQVLLIVSPECGVDAEYRIKANT